MEPNPLLFNMWLSCLQPDPLQEQVPSLPGGPQWCPLFPYGVSILLWPLLLLLTETPPQATRHPQHCSAALESGRYFPFSSSQRTGRWSDFQWPALFGEGPLQGLHLILWDSGSSLPSDSERVSLPNQMGRCLPSPLRAILRKVFQTRKMIAVAFEYFPKMGSLWASFTYPHCHVRWLPGLMYNSVSKVAAGYTRPGQKRCVTKAPNKTSSWHPHIHIPKAVLLGHWPRKSPVNRNPRNILFSWISFFSTFMRK